MLLPIEPALHSLDSDDFDLSRAQFEQLVGRLTGLQTRHAAHGDVEDVLWTEGNELLRRLMQAHLDVRSRAQERTPVLGADGLLRNHFNETSRNLDTRFGRVEVNRLSVGQREIGSIFPLDAELNLPPEVYSHGVQLRIVEEVARGSFADAVEAVSATTATSVPKRQLEEVAERAAADFDAFYVEHVVEEEVATDILAISADGKGVVMRTEDLRPETRKAAQTANHKLGKRLSKGEKKNRKRMATVAAVWSVAPWRREPEDIVRNLNGAEPREGPRPRAHNKRVWASVEREPADVIAEAFREADRRDPARQRRWVTLVDGNATQIRLATAEAKRRGVAMTLILDVIHAIEYLWKAAWCFFKEGDKEAEKWVSERLLRVLSGKVSHVAAGIRRSATKRGLDKKARENVDCCANYFLKYRDMMRYDVYLAAGFPIATGVIEGACRYLVKDRMDITGARWSLAGAEAVLRLRALRASGDLMEYWRFHQEQERLRNHVAKLHPSEAAAKDSRNGCTP